MNLMMQFNPDNGYTQGEARDVWLIGVESGRFCPTKFAKFDVQISRSCFTLTAQELGSLAHEND